MSHTYQNCFLFCFRISVIPARQHSKGWWPDLSLEVGDLQWQGRSALWQVSSPTLLLSPVSSLCPHTGKTLRILRYTPKHPGFLVSWEKCIFYLCSSEFNTSLSYIALLRVWIRSDLHHFAGSGSAGTGSGSVLVMSTIPKRKYKRSDIEAYCRNETKTFWCVPKKEVERF